MSIPEKVRKDLPKKKILAGEAMRKASLPYLQEETMTTGGTKGGKETGKAYCEIKHVQEERVGEQVDPQVSIQQQGPHTLKYMGCGHATRNGLQPWRQGFHWVVDAGDGCDEEWQHPRKALCTETIADEDARDHQ